MYWHVTLATEGRLPLARTLTIVATIVRVCGIRLLLFAVADDHIHALVAGERREVGAVLSGLACALARIVDVPLAPARIRPVQDRDHARRLVGYLAGQPRRHGAGAWDGTCLPDLIGARRIGFDPSRVAALLPREDVAALALRGAGFGPFAPASDALVRTHGVVRGWRAALATVGLAARGGRSAARLAADRAWRHLALAVGFGLEARKAAGILERRWQSLAAEPVDPAQVDAIRRQIAFEVNGSV